MKTLAKKFILCVIIIARSNIIYFNGTNTSVYLSLDKTVSDNANFFHGLLITGITGEMTIHVHCAMEHLTRGTNPIVSKGCPSRASRYLLVRYLFSLAFNLLIFLTFMFKLNRENKNQFL